MAMSLDNPFNKVFGSKIQHVYMHADNEISQTITRKRCRHCRHTLYLHDILFRLVVYCCLTCTHVSFSSRLTRFGILNKKRWNKKKHDYNEAFLGRDLHMSSLSKYWNYVFLPFSVNMQRLVTSFTSLEFIWQLSALESIKDVL